MVMLCYLIYVYVNCHIIIVNVTFFLCYLVLVSLSLMYVCVVKC